MINQTLFAQGDKRKVLTEIDVSDLHVSKYNPRVTRNAEDVDRLAKRIAGNGFELTRSLWVRKNDTGYEVFAGGNRLQAAGVAALEQVPCIIHEGYTDAEIVRLADEDNDNDEYHAVVPIVDVWMSYKALSDAGWTQIEIGKAKGVSRESVKFRLAFAEFPQAVLNRFLGTSDLLREAHAREIIALVHCTNFAPWLTHESAMLEVIDEVLTKAAKDKEQPTAKAFKAQVEKINGLIEMAGGFYEKLKESVELYDERNNFAPYPYDPRAAFVEMLAQAKARSKQVIKEAYAQLLDRIAVNIATYEAHVAALAGKAKKAAEAAIVAKPPYRLICAPINDLAAQIEPGSVDYILTDPPYPQEYLPVYSDLSRLAAHCLKPGGSMFVMVGQSYLPELLTRLGEHMTYHWTLAYLTPGGQAVQLWQRNVNTFWKPILWYVKGEYQLQGEEGNPALWLGDVAKSEVNDNDKRFHHWGQSESGMFDLVQRCTKPGSVILDPFSGGGTTGIAALRARRHYIGADIDATVIKESDTRLLDFWETLNARHTA